MFAYHSLYEVSFPNGQTEDLTENVIDDNMISQVDSEVHHYQVLKDISDHSSDGSALKRSDGFIIIFYGNLHAKNTTRCCKLEVEWKDGTLIWMPLKYIKASNPVEISECEVANNIEYETGFKCWVKDVLRKRDQIISKFKSKYCRTTHIFGIQVPKTVEEA